MGNNYNDYTSTAANTINQQNVIGNGQKINTVIGDSYAQSSNMVSPPPMVPLDANPGFKNMAKPLPDVVPVSNPYDNNNNNEQSLPGQLPNPYAMNNQFGGPPPPQFNGGPPQFGGPPPPQFGGPPPQFNGRPPQFNGGPPQFNGGFGGPPGPP